MRSSGKILARNNTLPAGRSPDGGLKIVKFERNSDPKCQPQMRVCLVKNALCSVSLPVLEQEELSDCVIK